MTNRLRRIRQHKEATGSRFTAQYKLDRLVYFERSHDMHRAIGREKQIKGLLRIKKIALIVSLNPTWRDLAKTGTADINSSRKINRFQMRRSFGPLRQDDSRGSSLKAAP